MHIINTCQDFLVVNLPAVDVPSFQNTEVFHFLLQAINYYEAALKTGQQNFLRLVHFLTTIRHLVSYVLKSVFSIRYDLAELYLKLKNYENQTRLSSQLWNKKKVQSCCLCCVAILGHIVTLGYIKRMRG